MKVNFSISPRILSHLGEDLIKNESIALFELIKNSYDANATSCEINFDFSNTPSYFFCLLLYFFPYTLYFSLILFLYISA